MQSCLDKNKLHIALFKSTLWLFVFSLAENVKKCNCIIYLCQNYIPTVTVMTVMQTDNY